MMTLRTFLNVCQLEKLDLVKGKGREFATTPVGKIFAASKMDWQKPVFIIQAGEDVMSAKGESLAGTYWFCNSAVQVTRTLNAE
jgi:hypothetical protein